MCVMECSTSLADVACYMLLYFLTPKSGERGMVRARGQHCLHTRLGSCSADSIYTDSRMVGTGTMSAEGTSEHSYIWRGVSGFHPPCLQGSVCGVM